MQKNKSEFGRGLNYCLALFLCHSQEERFKEVKKVRDNLPIELWFNASSDHLYDLQIPDNLPESLKKRLAKLCRKVIHWGHGFDTKDRPTKENKEWAIQEAKDLIRLIDKFYGIKVEKGHWE